MGGGAMSIDGEAKSILIVEDDFFVAAMMASIVQQAGFDVMGPTASVSEALGLIAGGPPDLALLDLMLAHGERSYPVAAELAARKIPFVFVTGESAQDLSRIYADVPVCPKPPDPRNIIGQINSLLGISDRAAAPTGHG
ncbi:response regulator [Inquilinus limosus]|uniref:response regulator n=1 Tax=Inquilinus limosus TaxID=171674 RepID=UPI0009DC04F7|nr:response regulator [Inquilinus limosus]